MTYEGRRVWFGLANKMPVDFKCNCGSEAVAFKAYREERNMRYVMHALCIHCGKSCHQVELHDLKHERMATA